MISLFQVGLVCVAAASDPATQVRNPHLAKGIQQLKDFEEDKALQSLERARNWRENTPSELALVWFYLGLAHAAKLDSEEAVQAFREALKRDPTLTCPPHLSPRVKAWWVEAGGTEANPTAPEVKPPPQEAKPPVSEPVPIAKPREVVPPPAIVAPPAPVEPRVERGARWPGVALCALGAAALGTGAALGLQAQSNHAAASAEPDVGREHRFQSTATSQASWANVSYVVGGLAGVGGGLLIVFPINFP